MAASHWIVLLLSVASVFPYAVQRSLRTKRNLLDLYRIVKCNTNDNPLKYVMYGCYCGLGGEGQPQDDLDRCCFEHDCCYGKLQEDPNLKGCKPKTDHYHWTCKKDDSECHEAKEGSCEDLLCNCDSKFAGCLKEHRHSFNLSLVIAAKFKCDKEPLQCP